MSAIIYPLLLVCLILVLNILSDLENKKNLLDNIKDEIYEGILFKTNPDLLVDVNGTYKSVLNLMTDGGFDKSNISYFYNGNQGYSWENGVIKINVGKNEQIFLRKDLFKTSGIKNHIFYARVSSKKTNANFIPGLYVIISDEFKSWPSNATEAVNFDTSSEINNWKNISTRFVASYDKISSIMLSQGNNAVESGTIYFDNFLILDLTDIYGAGNEPTQEWCDENIVYPQ